MALLVVAAFAKFYDLSEFHDTVIAWQFIPSWLAPLIAVFIPAMELYIALRWFYGGNKRRATMMCLLLLVVFTVSQIAFLAAGIPPECKCFGKQMEFMNNLGMAHGAIVRNLVLASMLCASLHFLARRLP